MFNKLCRLTCEHISTQVFITLPLHIHTVFLCVSRQLCLLSNQHKSTCICFQTGNNSLLLGWAFHVQHLLCKCQQSHELIDVTSQTFQPSVQSRINGAPSDISNCGMLTAQITVLPLWTARLAGHVQICTSNTDSVLGALQYKRVWMFPQSSSLRLKFCWGWYKTF